MRTTTKATEPKRCGACGHVETCLCVTCSACHQPRLRPLSEAERAVWEAVRGEEPALAARAVTVRCGL